MAAAISFAGVTRCYGAVAALEGVDLDVAAGRVTGLCGPPGCGKSVLLRLLVGLEAPDAGRILIGGRDVTRLAPGERPVGYVPQSFALYPHLSVFDNVAYPLALRRVAREEVRRRVERVAGLLGLDGLLGKRPAELSGGQKQRTALARGLVREAAVYVLDDPLVGLDFKLRERLVDDLRRLRAEVEAAFLYATSDPLEALAIADDVAVLDGGRVVEHAPADALYHAPRRLRSAELVGFPRCNVVPGRLGPDGRCETALGAFSVASDGAASLDAGEVAVAVRPEHLQLADGAVPGLLSVSGIVRLVEDLGAEVLVHFDLPGQGSGAADDTGALVTVIAAAAMPRGGLGPDAPLRLTLRPSDLAVFGPSGARLGQGWA